MPPYSWSTPGRKPGTSTKVTSGMLKASQVRTKRAAFSALSMSSTPASTIGWLPTMPTDWPLRRPKPHTMLLAQCGKYSKKSPSSTTSRDDLLHVVGLVRAGREELAQRRSHRRSGSSAGSTTRRLLQVVRRQERQQVAHVLEARLLVGRDEGGHAGLGGVAHGAAELLERDLLAGDRLHHVGPGDEHVRRLADHEDEVGHGRRVDGAAGARSEDHADLRHDARRQHVAVEDAAVAGQRDHALLDAGAGAVVEADDRRADLEGEVHQLVDLLGEHLAERAAEDGEVLAEDEHLAAVDRAPAGDDTVGVGPLLEARGVGPVAGQQVELLERAGVEQVLDPLAGEQLALGVLALDRPLASRRGTPGPCRSRRSSSFPASGYPSRRTTLLPPVPAQRGPPRHRPPPQRSRPQIGHHVVASADMNAE